MASPSLVGGPTDLATERIVCRSAPSRVATTNCATSTTRDYLEVGRKYRNCIASKLSHVASGRMDLTEFRGECLLEFLPLTGEQGWVFWDCHGHWNEPVAISTVNAAAAKSDVFGIA